MADPTAPLTLGTAVDPNRLEALIKTSEELVIGAYAAIATATGLLQFADSTAGIVPIGYFVGPSDGVVDSDGLFTGDGTKKAVVRGGVILNSVAVTGASAITDCGKDVWATDGQTLTLTGQTAGRPFGKVHKWKTSTSCDVYCYSWADQLQSSSAKESFFYLPLGTHSTNSILGTAAADIYKHTALEPLDIISLHAIPTSYDNACVAGSQTLNLEIGATNTTGGVLTLAYTSFDVVTDLGTVINATAITAANAVAVGDVITLELVASGTGFTPDLPITFEVFAKCRRKGV